MADEKIRLGGMALPNGVLVHGPKSWACAIRRPDGRLEVAAEPKRFVANDVKVPFLRGPARLVEALAVLPQVKRKLPAAPRSSAHSEPRPRSSAGWHAIPGAASRRRSLGPATSCSTGSRRPSRRA